MVDMSVNMSVPVLFALQDREKLSDEEMIKLLSNYSAT